MIPAYRPGKPPDVGAEPELRRGEATAVFAANDHVALGLLYAFAQCGRRVPGWISVVGYDDIPGSEYFQPAPRGDVRATLTTNPRRDALPRATARVLPEDRIPG